MSQAELAVTPGLARTLGSGAVLFLTLSATTPASSVFVIVPGMLHVAGSGALLAMLIAALICVATGFVYAELSAAWPHAGGEYVMVAHTLGPLAGFVVLGVNMVNNLAFLPVVALGLASVLARLIPGLPPIPVALVMLALATGVGLLNIRLNAWITGLFLLVELAALAMVAALGFAHPVRGLGAMLLHPQMPAATGFAPADFAAIGTAATIAVFALNGYGMAVYFGEELHEAPRRIARIVLWAVAATLAAELLPLAAALSAVSDLGAFVRHEDAFGAFIDAAGGPRLGDAIAIGVALAIFNAAIVSVLAFARVLFASARDQVWGGPLDRALLAIHPRLGSPWVATLAVGLIGMAGCFVPLYLLLVISGTGLVLTYAAIGLAALVGRRTGATAHSLYQMPLFPLWPLLTLVALVYIGWSNWLDPAGRIALIATGAQMLLAAGYYMLVLRRRGAWRVSGPADDRR